MQEEPESGGWREILLGVIVIVALIGAVYYSIRFVYETYFAPAPATISLSAYFVDDSGAPVSSDAPNYETSHLKVRGDVFRGGEAVKNGNVRLTLSIARNDLFRQSISLPFQNGHFETDDPAFRAVRPGASVEIKADVTAPGLVEASTIYLNSEPPVDKSTLEYGSSAIVLFLAVVFFLAFTGRKTPWKNRTAIIFSYLIIALFLGVPILAPMILIRTFPNAVDAMIGTPAGLVNTHTPSQPENETQWALNIGGYSFKVPSEGAGTARSQKVEEKSTPVTSPSTKEASQTGAPGVNGSTPASPSTNQGSHGNSSQLSGTADSAADRSSTHVSPAAEPRRLGSLPSVVQVQGGLVIPLYVIILSVFGGAINMTRKVPSFQREGEESDFSVARPISRVGTALINLTRTTGRPAGATPPAIVPTTVESPISGTAAAKPEPSLEDKAAAINEQLTPLLTEQIQSNCETDARLAKIRMLVLDMQDIYKSKKSDEPLLHFNSFEDWAASYPRLGELLRGSWRVELLNQYMYLISAPFLAIVTYYILDLLGLSKQGVVVVLSFSVGLVSERIVSWILGIATGYLRTDIGNQTPKKA